VLAAVAALNPDVTVIHAQQADRAGNVRLWGITGVQKEAVLAAKCSIVTVEEIVDDFRDDRNAVVLPSWTVTAIAHVPGGCYPSYAAGYSERDNDYYEAWDELSRDRQVFEEWLANQVYDQGGA
jgi:glutaconate CoA-transferase subunit A